MTHATSHSTGRPGTEACSRTPPIGVLFLNTLQITWVAEQLHAAIARGLDPARFRAFVATTADTWEAIDWGESRGVTVWRLPLGRGVSVEQTRAGRVRAVLANAVLLVSLLRLAVRMRWERIAVIHTSVSPRNALSGLVLSYLSGARLVIHWHNVFWGWYPLVWRLAFRRARVILAVSEASRRSLVEAGVPGAKIHVLYNGVDVERFHPGVDGRAVRRELGIAADAPLVLLAGRLEPGKGQAELIRAAALLRARGRRIEVLLVGRDDARDLSGGRQLNRPGLESLAAELGVRDQIHFVDHRGDMPAVMAAADVVALPSRQESFGLVLAEAMACGRPVVATRVGGVPEVVDDGVTGLLAPEGMPVAEGLACALERLLSDPALRERMGAAARAAVVSRFSLEAMVAGAAAYYEAVAGLHPAPAADTRTPSEAGTS